MNLYQRWVGCDEKKEPLTPRPCFVCGEMMEILTMKGMLICRPCDVTEAGYQIPYVSRLDGTVETGQFQGVTYIDHTQVYAPSPLRRPPPR